MRRLVLMAFVALIVLAPGFAIEAAAQVAYNFSWFSETTGRDVEGNVVTRRLSGQTTARVNVTPQLVILDFDTPFGPAHIEVQRGTLAFAQDTFLPFDIPPAINNGEGRGLYGDFWLATYAGPLDTPSNTLNITLRQPGSGPAPELTFVGAGTRQTFTALLTRPVDGATVRGTVSVGMRSLGGDGTDRTYRLLVDGRLMSTQTRDAGVVASFALNTSTLSNGRHTLTLRVTDEAGVVAVDTQAINVVDGASGAPSVTLNLTQHQVVRGSVPVRITATGLASGTKRFFMIVDGVQAGLQVVTSDTITWFFRTLNLSNGTHTLTVRAVDAAGRTVTRTLRVNVAN
jgi:hypothetical protein